MISHKDHSIVAQRRATWRKIAPDHELGVETDSAKFKNARAIGGVRVDPRRLNTSGESTRSSERGALVSYFRDIAEIPTLVQGSRKFILAKEIEAATLEFRDAMISRAVDVRWRRSASGRQLQSEGRATGKMCESFGSGSPEGEDLGARKVDGHAGQDSRPRLLKREKPPDRGRQHGAGDPDAWRRKMPRRLIKEADLSMQLHGAPAPRAARPLQRRVRGLAARGRFARVSASSAPRTEDRLGKKRR